MEWISVKDRKPEPFQRVLACFADGLEPTVDVCRWDGKMHFDGKKWIPMEEAITRWMPLPDPPSV